MSERDIRSVAVVGGGIVGLSAALAFKRSLPPAEVTVVQSANDPAALADRMPTAWPTIHRLHALLRIDELDLVRTGIAVHHLGTIVEDWTPGRSGWVHAFAPHGKPAGAVAFDQIWLQAQSAGRARSYESYSMGAVLARSAKFAHPSSDRNAVIGRFGYGFRLDPDGYRDRLAEIAAAAGIQFAEAAASEPLVREDRHVAGVLLEGSGRIEADLYLDCSGPRAQLIGAIDDSFEACPSHLVKSLDLGSSELAAPSPVARVRAVDEGWEGEWPLRDRVLTVRARTHSAAATAIRPGRRTRPWVRNVLAIGDSAAAMDPLHGMNLDLAHRAILLALELLPGRDMNPLVLAEYNRRWALIADQARDFIALHYSRAAPAAMSQSLARRIDQFEHRGRLPFQEEETLDRDDWTAALLGLGFRPAAIDPVAAGVPIARAIDAMEKLADECVAAAASVPAYSDYLARMVTPSSAAT